MDIFICIHGSCPIQSSISFVLITMVKFSPWMHIHFDCTQNIRFVFPVRNTRDRHKFVSYQFGTNWTNRFFAFNGKTTWLWISSMAVQGTRSHHISRADIAGQKNEIKYDSRIDSLLNIGQIYHTDTFGYLNASTFIARLIEIFQYQHK